MREISVILPTLNEKENIKPLIEEIFHEIREDTEVIVVDDDSPDGTWAVVEELSKTNPNLFLLRRKGERGLASALEKGIAFSKGEVVVWMDCDLSMPPETIKTLYAEIVKGYDMAIGSRFVDGGGVEIITGSRDTFLAYLLSLVLNRFVQFVLGSSVKDYTSGFIAVKRKILERIPLSGDYGEYFIGLVYRAREQGYRILEVPYICKARRRGTSKTGSHLFHYLKRGSKYIWLTLKLKFSKQNNKKG